jgi:hypothetical protein
MYSKGMRLTQPARTKTLPDLPPSTLSGVLRLPEPMLARAGRIRPPGWLFEPKLDGWKG